MGGRDTIKKWIHTHTPGPRPLAFPQASLGLLGEMACKGAWHIESTGGPVLREDETYCPSHISWSLMEARLHSIPTDSGIAGAAPGTWRPQWTQCQVHTPWGSWPSPMKTCPSKGHVTEAHRPFLLGYSLSTHRTLWTTEEKAFCLRSDGQRRQWKRRRRLHFLALPSSCTFSRKESPSHIR